MIIKNSIYGNKWGFLDPQVLDRTKNKPYIEDSEVNKDIDLSEWNFSKIREDMGSANKDLSTGKVNIKDFLIPCNGRYILARKYMSTRGSLDRSCLVYLHGGGFIGGSLNTIENQCKLIADRSNSVVISLEYRLAPETAFPGQYLDVSESLNWISNNSEKLKFNRQKLYVAGDSAGGNLAVACGLMDKKGIIRRIISIYGALDLTNKDRTIYNWKYADYEMSREHKPYIHTRLNKFAIMVNLIGKIYSNYESIENPLISPVYASEFNYFPPITMVEAEFDYFIQSNKYFVKKLENKNKDVDVILYKGLDHGFFDRLGYLRQAEDLIDEIVKIIN